MAFLPPGLELFGPSQLACVVMYNSFVGLKRDRLREIGQLKTNSYIDSTDRKIIRTYLFNSTVEFEPRSTA
jgi:hypothetical protein